MVSTCTSSSEGEKMEEFETTESSRGTEIDTKNHLIFILESLTNTNWVFTSLQFSQPANIPCSLWISVISTRYSFISTINYLMPNKILVSKWISSMIKTFKLCWKTFETHLRGGKKKKKNFPMKHSKTYRQAVSNALKTNKIQQGEKKTKKHRHYLTKWLLPSSTVHSSSVSYHLTGLCPCDCSVFT